MHAYKIPPAGGKIISSVTKIASSITKFHHKYTWKYKYKIIVLNFKFMSYSTVNLQFVAMWWSKEFPFIIGYSDTSLVLILDLEKNWRKITPLFSLSGEFNFHLSLLLQFLRSLYINFLFIMKLLWVAIRWR